MKQDELQKVLENHILWWNGKGGERANLSGANLSCADLSCANLSCADLSCADLSGADLSGANLSCANLRGAHLNHADLRYARLSHGDLRGADLSGANLSCADLSCADLSGADLSDADLRYADLRYANLSCADLSCADLSDADLSCANLRGANIEQVQYDESTTFFALQCPEEGSFIGWKKCADGVVVKLLIPEDAERCSATSRKCRASKAIVLEVIGAEKAISMTDPRFVYEAGKEVLPDAYDSDRWNECSHGIHFFVTRKEAENY